MAPGSPPHGRGKAPSKVRPASGMRITPAWAGKSWSWGSGTHRTGDHPRMGGEKRFQLSENLLHPGSPPHGRGKGTPARSSCKAVGITPAWAGKRRRGRAGTGAGKDHPRMGGEKLLSKWGQGWPLGSPPHGRGKGPLRAGSLSRSRITPAWAGKSRGCARGQTRAQDHPRMGGEKDGNK